MNFTCDTLDIPDVKLIHTKAFKDDRGFFAETFRSEVFRDFGLPDFVQSNCSLSKRGTVRGLHYQLNPKPQAKLVSCIKGYIVDVAVDIRPKSKTYGQYIKVELFGPLSMLYIPEGFAHGFMALEDDTIVSYQVSNYYDPNLDRAVRWNDPDININWYDQSIDKIVSDKDMAAPLLRDADNNF